MTIDRLRALELHRKARGKIKIYPTINVRNEEDLGLAYVPGSVYPSLAITEDPALSFDYTGRGNRIAVVTDGSAVLGIGNVGPEAALPVMEGKCLLFKLFGDINAIPVCLDTSDPEEIIHHVRLMAPTLGGVNIEDISSPNTFTVVRKLRSVLDIPVLCDDQHGTAVLVLAALKNALKVVQKNLPDVRIAVIGAGAAGVATSELLLAAGARNIVCLNSAGILGEDNPKMDHVQRDLSLRINPEGISGGIDEALRGADVMIGLSKGNLVTGDHVKSMASRAIVFALALPEPEIPYEEAVAAGAAVVATGTAEHPNPLLNLQAFPGIMRGALDVRANTITDSMLLAAADALASVTEEHELSPQNILADPFCDESAPRVAEAVAQKAVEEGMASLPVPPGQVYNDTWQRLHGSSLVRI
ncbi:MAG: NAD-dependent malic enzyme [Thermanaerothrix sp.]|nr:NAD-dependent malic enzyme [Thermanaerothrix sp.]